LIALPRFSDGEQCAVMLTIQYRMHQSIMEYFSNALYGGRLVADPSVAQHLLPMLPGVREKEDTLHPLVVLDTAGCGMEETEEEGSKYNVHEVELVQTHLASLVAAGVRADQIAVIAPYNAQVNLLRERLLGLYPGLEVGTVDGFQGREKEAVVISLVRSNADRSLGFLKVDARTNVAVTRSAIHTFIHSHAPTRPRSDSLACWGMLSKFAQTRHNLLKSTPPCTFFCKYMLLKLDSRSGAPVISNHVSLSLILTSPPAERDGTCAWS
jgi:hypothetical protein